MSLSRISPRWLVIVAAFLWLAMPSPAMAQGFGIDECNARLGNNISSASYLAQYTKKVITCLEGTMKQASRVILVKLSAFMMPILYVMFVFSITVFGARIAGGEKELKRKAASFMIRLALVWFFFHYLEWYSIKMFEIAGELVCLVSGCQYDPWADADMFIGKMFGFGTSFSLVSGLFGIVSGSLFSSTMGAMLAIFGAMALLDILLFILRVIFTYLTAILVIAFLVTISPLIIPTAIFFSTDRYFRKWTDIMISALITPMLLFAFLQMFMGVFDKIANDTYQMLGWNCANPTQIQTCLGRNCPVTPAPNCPQPDFSAFQRMNEPKLAWLMPADPNFSGSLKNITESQSDAIPAVASNINPLLRRGLNANMLNTPGVNFGEAGNKIIPQLIFAFLKILIFATLMKSLVGRIPEVANNIAGAVSGVQMQPTTLESNARSALKEGRKDALNRGLNI